jgi:hypothetical protein
MAVKKRKAVGKSQSYAGYIIDGFVVLILFVFPLFFTNFYYNLHVSKYYFYIGAVAALLAALIYAALKKRCHIEKRMIKEMCVTDWAFLILWLVGLISTCSSKYVSASFWGNEGRLSGLFLHSLFLIAYFAVTRFGIFRTWYLDIFLVSSLLVCLFGITDYFDMDILHFKEEISPDHYYIFTSTIGNINFYTAFIAMVTPVAAVLYSQEAKTKKQVFYYICYTASLFAIVMGVSDNAVLSIGILFALLPLYLFGKKNGIRKYLILTATFFTVLQCISWINIYMADRVLGIESAFNFIMNFKGLIVITAGLWLLIVLWYGAEHIVKKKLDLYGKIPTALWLAGLFAVFAAALFLLYDVNINHNVERYSSLNNYLLLNDDWGTHRGYIWRNALECFRDFTPVQKLFGYGPDTFGVVMLEKTWNNPYKEIFDSAHNEYLHYLTTFGILGLTAYVTYLLSFIIKGIRYTEKNPYMAACIFSVICYSTQAFVNISNPTVSPVFHLLVALGILGCRTAKNQK